MWRHVLKSALGFTARVLVNEGPPVQNSRRWTSANVRITKGLKKMLERHGNSKKKIFHMPVNMNNPSGVDDVVSGEGRRHSCYTDGQRRRAQQVGRVLFQHIVQLIHSVDIVNVKVVPDFSAVNIYWLTTGTADDDCLEKMLRGHEPQLRQELTSLHILGNVPRLNFVRDHSRAHCQRVDSLLSTADLGPDFIPTKLDTAIRSSLFGNKGQDKPSLSEQFYQMAMRDDQHVADTTCDSELAKDDVSYGIKTPKVKSEDRAIIDSSSKAVNNASSAGSTYLSTPFSDSNTEPSSCYSKEPNGSSKETAGDIETLDGFRQDLNRVDHTALMAKVKARKNRHLTHAPRPLAGMDGKVTEQGSHTELDTTSLHKLRLLQQTKKARVKVNRKSQSDYDYVIDGWH